jgi:D-glycero-D-manno-heptose 1,7-bisphosphate phosphatase
VAERKALRRAVFLDRDGVICEEMGYVNHVSRLRIFPFAAAAIRRLNEASLAVVAVTNQAGVSQGYFPESLVQQVHEKLAAELAKGNAHLDAIYFCPHKLADGCNCRKPLPGMIERAAREHDLDPASSYMIGDKYADLEVGFRCGAKAILVMTGYGQGDYELHHATWPRQPDHVVADLTAAVDLILGGAR